LRFESSASRSHRHPSTRLSTSAPSSRPASEVVPRISSGAAGANSTREAAIRTPTSHEWDNPLTQRFLDEPLSVPFRWATRLSLLGGARRRMNHPRFHFVVHALPQRYDPPPSYFADFIQILSMATCTREPWAAPLCSSEWLQPPISACGIPAPARCADTSRAARRTFCGIITRRPWRRATMGHGAGCGAIPAPRSTCCRGSPRPRQSPRTPAGLASTSRPTTPVHRSSLAITCSGTPVHVQLRLCRLPACRLTLRNSTNPKATGHLY
jgi:hypothetical protein